MIDKRSAWNFAAAAGAALLVAVGQHAVRASGIDHTLGAKLVVASTALLFGAALVLALWSAAPALLRWALLAASLCDVMGTALAAYFLHAWLLLALMAAALAGWLALVLPLLGAGGGGRGRERAA